MVQIQSSPRSRKKPGILVTQKLVTVVVVVIGFVYFVIAAGVALSRMDAELEAEEQQLRRRTGGEKPKMVQLEKGQKDDITSISESPCQYKSLSDLSEEELQPVQGSRHMVTPPIGGKLSLVCCQTTAGPLSIVAHHKWAPNGAEHFMDMVTSGYMNSGVPMMRCVKNFLCQVGGDVSSWSVIFSHSLGGKY